MERANNRNPDRKQAILAIIAVSALLTLTLITLSGSASASSQYDGVFTDQPNGTQTSPAAISGTYEFEATVTVAQGESAGLPAFVINGSSYTPSLISQPTGNLLYAEYVYGYNFVTGVLPNGEFAWHASVTISGVQYTSSAEYYTVKNSIAVSFEGPTTGESVSGIVTATILTEPSSSNSVTSVAINIGSLSVSTSETAVNQWQGSFPSMDFPNGLIQLSAMAAGTMGTNGSGTEVIDINNAVSSGWDVSYDTFQGQVYSSPLSPMMSTTYSLEGPSFFAQGTLPIYPNSLTKTISVTIPGAIHSVQSLYFPLDASPYYVMTSSRATNWTDPASNPLTMSGVFVGNNSSFGTPSAAVTSSSVMSTASPLVPANLSSGAWTLGFYAQMTPSFSFGGASYGGNALQFESIDVGGSYYLQMVLRNSTGYSLTITSNSSIPLGSWFSAVATFDHVGSSNFSYGNMELYVDGNISWHTPQTHQFDFSFYGLGTVLENGGGHATSLADVFTSDSILSPRDIGQMIAPDPWQLYQQIQPPYYFINQTYFGLTIQNGSGPGAQPWSGVDLAVQEIQPQIFGQLTVSLTSTLGQQLFSSYRMAAEYTPYLSTEVYNITPLTNILSVPLYASVSIQIYNAWNQQVGGISNFSMASTQEDVSVYIDLTLLSFQFVNTTEGQVVLSANGLSQTVFGQAIVSNNSEYHYSTTVFSNGKSTVLSGNLTTYRLQETYTIYADAPPAQVVVTVYAYNSTGIGSVFTRSSSGTPYVELFIDGSPFQTGAGYATQVGDVLSIRVADAINQTLYLSNYSVLNQYNPISITITTKSWVLGLTNDEQASPNSTLSTETVYLNSSDSAYHGVFKNSVGESLQLYLLQGNYSIYLHDNATFRTNITLDANSYYTIFGQQLLTAKQFSQLEGAIYNNTAHLLAVPLSSPVSSLAGAPLSYLFALSFPNGTALSLQQTRDVIQNASFSAYDNSNGTLAARATLTEPASDEVSASLSMGRQGSYDIVFESFLQASGSVFSLRYTTSLSVLAPLNFSYGVSLKVSGPSVIEVNHTATFTVLITYDNGTALNYTDTLSVQRNITADVYDDGQFVQTVPVSLIAAGRLGFSYTPLQASQGYSIVVSVSPTTIGSAKASAEFTGALSAVDYNPSISPGQDVLNSLVSTLVNSANIIVVVFGLAGGLYAVYRFLRRRSIRIRNKLDAIDSAIQAQVISQGLSADERRAIVSAIPRKVRKRLFGLLQEKGGGT